MAQTLRAESILWDGTVSTGAGGASAAVQLGALTCITFFIWNKDGATPTTIVAQCGETKGKPGQNAIPTDWFNLYDGTTGGEVSWSVSAGGKIAVNVPNMGATIVRLTSTADVLVYATVAASD